MLTKAIILSINDTGNRCVVRMPLFETPNSSEQVTAEALINISPGMFNNLEVGDVVFIGFEENALEKPIILGKLFRTAELERSIRGGGGVFNTLNVNAEATLPASTLFVFPPTVQKDYIDLKTPKKMADYIKWLENFTKVTTTQIDENFRCFKNWTQWQLSPENVEIDDGDLDEGTADIIPCQYQDEGATCKICGSSCTKKSTREYAKLDLDKKYPNI